MPKILVLVYGPYNEIMGIRARNLFRYFPKKLKINIAYRKSNNVIDTIRFFFITIFNHPGIIYMIDTGLPSLIAAFFSKYLSFKKVKIFLDTGDLVYIFATAEKKRNFFIEKLIYYTEQLSRKIADKIIVRGSYYKTYLQNKGFKNVEFIPDGVSTEVFKPKNVSRLRKKLGLDKVMTIGTMGHLYWFSAWQWCYGWYLINSLKYLKNEKIKAIIIGKGEALKKLKQRAKELSVSDKVVFTGRVPSKDFVAYLNLIDIFVFTQPHHIQTKIRTCAKLPQLLATGRFIVSTDLYEPKKLIKDNGIIVPFRGLKDKDYPERLAKSIKNLLKEKGLEKKGLMGVKIAKEKYDYRLLSKNLQKIF